MPRLIYENSTPMMIREGDPIGEYLSVSYGTEWKRLMPDGNDASLVAPNQLDIKAGFRDTLLSVGGWNLMILNNGYFEERTIKSYNDDDNMLTLTAPLTYYESLKTSGAGVEWVMYPSLLIPLGISFKRGGDSELLEIGVAKENTFDPSASVKKFAELDDGELFIMHTAQIQKIFYKIPPTDSSGPTKFGDISWGEHYRA